MATTALLVEFLVAGLVACLWALPLGIAISQSGTIPSIGADQIESWFVGAGILYTLGAVTSFLADRAFARVDRRLLVEKHSDKEEMQVRRAAILLSGKDAAAEYMMQRRSQVRLFRANAFSAFLAIPVVALNVGGALTVTKLSTPACIALLLLIAAIFTWAYVRTLRGYFALVHDLGKIIND